MNSNVTSAVKELAEKYKTTWISVLTDETKPINSMIGSNVDLMFSDLTALINEHYVDKDIHDGLVERADKLQSALVDMVSQFAYQGTKDGQAAIHTGGLSALEDAFDILGWDDPSTIMR